MTSDFPRDEAPGEREPSKGVKAFVEFLSYLVFAAAGTLVLLGVYAVARLVF